MSILAQKVDEALSRFDLAQRVELESVVTMTIERLNANAPPRPTTAEERHALLLSCAGSLPDFPDDYEDGSWETDRDPLP